MNEQRRRVLTIVHNPVFGGGLNQVAQLREPLERRGWETVAVVTDEEGNAASRLRELGVDPVVMRLHRLRATANPITHARTFGTLPGEVAALRRLIEEREIDLVQVHGDTNPHGALAARRAGAAVVWELYDTRTPPPLRRVTMPLVTRLADVITTWGEGLAKVHPGATSLGDRQVAVFPPVDPDRFHPPSAEERAGARRALGVPADAFVLGSVGNRNPSKGHEWLVRALKSASAREPSLRARVLGAPSPVHAAHERSLRAEAADLERDGVIAFIDPGGGVPELIRGFDALVVASVPRSEGIPTVILEAMASALPVVSTTVGAIDEVVELGRTGLLVPPEDSEALAGALVKLAAHREEAAEMGRTGRERVLDRYQLEACADRRVLAYERALAHRASVRE